MSAEVIVQKLLESEDLRGFLKRHKMRIARRILIKPDPQHPGYVLIPTHSGYANWLKLGEKPEEDLQLRLQSLVLNRPGIYKVGDHFISPWGRFIVDQEMKVTALR